MTAAVPDREAIKQHFLTASGFGAAERQPLPGDASTRRYERLIRDGRSYMLMDQPPSVETQPCRPEQVQADRVQSGYNAMARLAAGRIEAFVAAAGYLRSQGLSAPQCHELDAEQGLLISEDLGDDLFAALIAKGQDEQPLYMAAIEALAQLHELTPPAVLPGQLGTEGWPLLSYDDLALKTGAGLFTEWYPRYAGGDNLSDKALAEWEALWSPLRQRAEAGATAFAHRDYHAENLMWLPGRTGVARVGMIDFQDCLRAHPSWDLLSLLQDARRDVSPELERSALDHYFSLRPHIDRAAFMADYNALATLNEARILGIFARLVVHFKKPRYAQFIPRMWRHIGRNVEAPGMEGLKDWFHAYGFSDKLGG
ncbi:N-acetylmuramate/N-acetylglucosamine kinase AmgK [Asticcacaulis sp. AC402]|uniref:N-acetylmuramate/N-acetylglucosamine kinase AmgK n=1 Tax=Asticcacaulis sp. AC402 TaxID=1282361 RepID=UPI0003C3D704|nr:phosphotransferase [Asticcacaulis sp. AC402]ESQ75808.1 aminoglycoside phosphotransferase [Asticcacaulis sp. AC402]